MIWIKLISVIVALTLIFTLLGCVGYAVYCLYAGMLHEGFLAVGIAFVITLGIDFTCGENHE